MNNMHKLGYFMQKGGLVDVKLRGSSFTQLNKRLGNQLIQMKLDRVMVNYEWARCFKDFTLEALPKTRSNHSPLQFLFSNLEKHKGSPFKFKMMWIKHPDFRKKVEEWWNVLIQGHAMYRFSKNLDQVKRQVKGLNKEVFQNIHDLKVQTNKDLNEIERRIQDEGKSQDLDKIERELVENLEELLNKEEIHWRQKSKAIWVIEGDRNTKFFHMTVVKHIVSNMIITI